jgi:aminocarboxymuconate-semialdehyde decarboxylase
MAIDVHAHYVPPVLLDELEQRGKDFGIHVHHAPGCLCAFHFEGGPKLRPFFPALVEPIDARKKAMDRSCVQRQVLSTWTDIAAPHLDAVTATKWHGFLNGGLCKVCEVDPDRFSYLASLPVQDGEAAARVLEREVRENGAVGAVIAANCLDVNLGELRLDPLWETASALDVGIFIHPVQAVPQKRSAKFGLTQSVQYTMDSTMSAGSLIMSGVLDRYPKLRLLLSHGGGSLPYLIGRFDCMHERMDKVAQGDVAQHKPSAYLRRFFYDTIVHDPGILHWLSTRVSVMRLVLGSDYSFPPADLDPIGTVRAAGFEDIEVAAILRDNALALFPALVGRE